MVRGGRGRIACAKLSFNSSSSPRTDCCRALERGAFSASARTAAVRARSACCVADSGLLAFGDARFGEVCAWESSHGPKLAMLAVAALSTATLMELRHLV